MVQFSTDCDNCGANHARRHTQVGYHFLSINLCAGNCVDVACTLSVSHLAERPEIHFLCPGALGLFKQEHDGVRHVLG